MTQPDFAKVGANSPESEVDQGKLAVTKHWPQYDHPEGRQMIRELTKAWHIGHATAQAEAKEDIADLTDSHDAMVEALAEARERIEALEGALRNLSWQADHYADLWEGTDATDEVKRAIPVLVKDLRNLAKMMRTALGQGAEGAGDD